MQRLRHRLAFRARLLSNETVVANIARLRRIAQIEDFYAAASPAVCFFIGDEVSDARVAFPPVLVSRSETGDHRAYQYRLSGIGNIPDLMRFVPEGTEHIGLVRSAHVELPRVANPDHLRAPRLARALGGAGNMSESSGIAR